MVEGAYSTMLAGAMCAFVFSLKREGINRALYAILYCLSARVHFFNLLAAPCSAVQRGFFQMNKSKQRMRRISLSRAKRKVKSRLKPMRSKKKNVQ